MSWIGSPPAAAVSSSSLKARLYTRRSSTSPFQFALVERLPIRNGWVVLIVPLRVSDCTSFVASLPSMKIFIPEALCFPS